MDITFDVFDSKKDRLWFRGKIASDKLLEEIGLISENMLYFKMI